MKRLIVVIAILFFIGLSVYTAYTTPYECDVRITALYKDDNTYKVWVDSNKQCQYTTTVDIYCELETNHIYKVAIKRDKITNILKEYTIK